jgi:hypothetical protein
MPKLGFHGSGREFRKQKTESKRQSSAVFNSRLEKSRTEDTEGTEAMDVFDPTGQESLAQGLPWLLVYKSVALKGAFGEAPRSHSGDERRPLILGCLPRVNPGLSSPDPSGQKRDSIYPRVGKMSKLQRQAGSLSYPFDALSLAEGRHCFLACRGMSFPQRKLPGC